MASSAPPPPLVKVVATVFAIASSAALLALVLVVFATTTTIADDDVALAPSSASFLQQQRRLRHHHHHHPAATAASSYLPAKGMIVDDADTDDDDDVAVLRIARRRTRSDVVVSSKAVLANNDYDEDSDYDFDDDFFGEDFWYAFRPIPAREDDDVGEGEEEGVLWEVRRRRRRHQEEEEGKEKSVVVVDRRLQQQQQQQSPETAIANADTDAKAETNADAAAAKANDGGSEEEEGEEQHEYFFLVKNGLLSLLCVITAALAAGLTMGMLSLDPLSLEIKRRASSDEEERRWSEQLLPLLVGHSKRHRLLVSLLLLNSLANEALPLFLDELLPGKYAAIIVSVTLVLFFGEIVPSAFFTGPDQVKVAAGLVPLVNTVMFVLTPIALPIARVLDRVLHDDDGNNGTAGHDAEEAQADVTEGNYYNRTELSALVRIQYESQLADKRRRKLEQNALLLAKSAGGVGGRTSVATGQAAVGSRESGSNHNYRAIRSISKELAASERSASAAMSRPQRMPSIHHDEITMIEGALAMTTKRAVDVCTPITRVYALPSDTILDEDKKVEMWAKGYSRVPVYCPREEPPSSDGARRELMKTASSIADVDVSGIVGVLLVRSLIVIDDVRPLSNLPLATPSCVPPSKNLVDLINLFQKSGGRGKGGLHLAVVCARPDLGEEALERNEPIPKEAGVVGIVTLEDVVEELLQEEIYDESDRDLELSQWGVIKWRAFVKRKKLRRLHKALREKAATSAAVSMTEQTPLLE